MCRNTCCWSLSTYMVDMLWVCTHHPFDRKLQYWFSTLRRWTWEGCRELRNPCVWSLWPEALPEKDESASSSQTGLPPPPPPNGEWPCCLSAARERKTPLFPWAEAPGEGVSLCLLSFVAWETQKRKVCLGGRSLVAWSVGDECLASWRGSSSVWGG